MNDDPRRKEAFGGRVYHMCKALREQFDDFDYIAPLAPRGTVSLLAGAKRRFYRWRHRTYSPNRDRLFMKQCAKTAKAALSRNGVDLVFSPMSPGSQPIAYLDCPYPIVVWTDTTFAGATELYPHLSPRRLCRETVRDAWTNERAALRASRLLIFSSDWAAETAIAHYQLDPGKVEVVPFGPNLDDPPTAAAVRDFIAERPADKCRLLFIGGGWDRKGGPVAVRVAAGLQQAGLDTELTVVGGRPPADEPLPDCVDVKGFIHKSTEEGSKQIASLFARSHFFIMPTRADCTPFVFPEANAFGVPVLTTDVGGISTVVRNGVNGWAFPVTASCEAFAEYVLEMFSDYAAYRRLASSSREEYENRLNWKTSARTIRRLADRLIS